MVSLASVVVTLAAVVVTLEAVADSLEVVVVRVWAVEDSPEDVVECLEVAVEPTDLDILSNKFNSVNLNELF